MVLAGGGLLFHQLFWVPLGERNASIQALQQDLEKKQDRIRQVAAERTKLERARQLSLPADTDLARREYEEYLSDLLRESGFAPGFSITAKPVEKSSAAITGKGPIYMRLPFAIMARANLASFVAMQERFYHAPLLHQIKNLSVQRPLTPGQQEQPGELDIQMTVEAIVVSGAENRSYLLPSVDRRLLALDVVSALRGGPAGFALIPWAVGPTGPRGPGVLAQPGRHYADIAKKNIFLGSSQSTRAPEYGEVVNFIHLTDITHNDRLTEAFFYDRANRRWIRLRAETGFDTFRVLDNEGETLLSGKVIRLDNRDLIFRVDKNYYSIHVDQSLGDVIKKPLTEEQLRSLGLAALLDKEGAEKISSGN
jgi:hypothetical protein